MHTLETTSGYRPHVQGQQEGGPAYYRKASQDREVRLSVVFVPCAVQWGMGIDSMDQVLGSLPAQ